MSKPAFTPVPTMTRVEIDAPEHSPAEVRAGERVTLGRQELSHLLAEYKQVADYAQQGKSGDAAMSMLAKAQGWKRAGEVVDVMGHIVDKWKTDPSGFYGGTSDDALRYMRRGYRVGELLADFLPGVLRTREGTALRGQWRWSDSGEEIDVGLALSGDPDPFRAFESAPTVGGLNVRVNWSFSCGTESNVITQYATWIARLLSTCEGAGVSPGLEIRQYLRGINTDDPSVHAVETRVKHEGEAMDWHRYSCLFSPIGYRHFGFMSIARWGAEVGRKPYSFSGGLGRPLGASKWGVRYDQAARVLTLDSPATPNNFPAETMTTQLRESGALAPTEGAHA